MRGVGLAGWGWGRLRPEAALLVALLSLVGPEGLAVTLRGGQGGRWAAAAGRTFDDAAAADALAKSQLAELQSCPLLMAGPGCEHDVFRDIDYLPPRRYFLRYHNRADPLGAAYQQHLRALQAHGPLSGGKPAMRRPVLWRPMPFPLGKNVMFLAVMMRIGAATGRPLILSEAEWLWARGANGCRSSGPGSQGWACYFTDRYWPKRPGGPRPAWSLPPEGPSGGSNLGGWEAAVPGGDRYPWAKRLGKMIMKREVPGWDLSPAGEPGAEGGASAGGGGGGGRGGREAPLPPRSDLLRRTFGARAVRRRDITQLWLTAQAVRYALDVQPWVADHVERLRGALGWRPGDAHAPAIAMHVRHGDSCMQVARARGATRRGNRAGRPCYPLSLHVEAARRMRERYNATTILLATDASDVAREAQERYGHEFDWKMISIDRGQLEGERGRNMGNPYTPYFLEHRAAAGEIDREWAVLTALADLDLLGDADMFIGSAESQYSRIVFFLIWARTGQLPPFSNMDFSFCCNFRTEEHAPCAKTKPSVYMCDLPL